MTEDRDTPPDDDRAEPAPVANEKARRERVHRVIDEIRERQGWRKSSEKEGTDET